MLSKEYQCLPQNLSYEGQEQPNSEQQDLEVAPCICSPLNGISGWYQAEIYPG